MTAVVLVTLAEVALTMLFAAGCFLLGMRVERSYAEHELERLRVRAGVAGDSACARRRPGRHLTPLGGVPTTPPTDLHRSLPFYGGAR